MDKLTQLADMCKAEVSININGHRSMYETIEQYLTNRTDKDDFVSLDKGDDATLVELQFYPHTPIGSYTIYDNSVEVALDEALEIMEQLRKEGRNDHGEEH